MSGEILVFVLVFVIHVLVTLHFGLSLWLATIYTILSHNTVVHPVSVASRIKKVQSGARGFRCNNVGVPTPIIASAERLPLLVLAWRFDRTPNCVHIIVSSSDSSKSFSALGTGFLSEHMSLRIELED